MIMQTDDQLDRLLGVYALDAVDPDERREVERYLRRSPRARQEVAEHIETAALLGNITGTAHPNVWERIEAIIDDMEQPAPMPFTPVIVPSSVRPGEPVRPSPKARQNGSARRRGQAPITAIAAIAASVIAVLWVTVARQNSRLDRLSANSGRSISQDRVNFLLTSAATRESKLRSSDGRLQVRAIIGTDGEGYLIGAQLPVLPPGHTYQLWGVKQQPGSGTEKVLLSLGVFGRSFTTMPFAADEEWTRLAITDEIAPGVVTSTASAVAAGTFV